MLILTRKKDEKIIIGDEIEITVVEIEGGQVQLGIDAPDHIEIHREEVYQRIAAENIEAAGQRQVKLEQLQKLGIKEEEDSDTGDKVANQVEDEDVK